MHEGAEVVVGEDHSRGLLGDLAAAAHRHADVRLLERRRVVDSVSGHRDDHALALHDLGKPKLVLRRHPAEDVQLWQARAQLVVGHGLQLSAAHGSGPEAERLADRVGGDRVVAGDHADVDPRVQVPSAPRPSPPRATGR